MVLYLRKVVIEDMEDIYQWAIDPEVRKNSFHTEGITYESHEVWFESVLKNPNILQYVLEDRSEKVEDIQIRKIGQIRVLLEKEEAIISYSIAKEQRGKGYGVRIVSLVEEKIGEVSQKTVMCVAKVKYDNKASIRVFEKCGYTKYEKSNYLEYRKQIK